MLKTFLFNVGYFLLYFLLSGCVTPGMQYLNELEESLKHVQVSVVAALPQGLRKVSSNEREFSSKYFTVRGGKTQSARVGSIRYYAFVTVLGDRRPYSVEILVFKEKRTKGYGKKRIFIQSGTDESIAKMVKRRIQNQLSKRRDDLNVIDDFRVF